MPDNPLVDSMNMRDQEVKVDLRCALCNEPVQAGKPHTCAKKEKDNASSSDR